MGQEVAPFLDRSATTTATNSINFIDFIALPFFKNFGKLDPKLDREVVAVLYENRQRWDEQKDKQKCCPNVTDAEPA
jgi:hypothetical protein